MLPILLLVFANGNLWLDLYCNWAVTIFVPPNYIMAVLEDPLKCWVVTSQLMSLFVTSESSL